MTARNDRGWWRRLRGSSADEDPFPPGERTAWLKDARSERERNERERRANRRWLSLRGERP